MTRDEVIELMAWMKGRVTGLALRSVNEIIAIAMSYSFLGREFTFDWSKDLDDAVNDILIQFTDAVLEETGDAVASRVEEEDREQVLAYIGRPQDGEDPEQRLDKHGSQLKTLLEAYLAVCFAMNLDRERILADATLFLSSPNQYQDMRDAFFDHDYKSRLIQQGGAHFGRGNPDNPIIGATLVANTMLNQAFQYDTLLTFGKDPSIIGYKVHRGSGYDCEYCDELCVGIHPLDEIVLPAHPRCMCYMTPVRASDIL